MQHAIDLDKAILHITMIKQLFLLAACLFTALPTLSDTALFTNPASTYERVGVTCTEGRLTGPHGALYSRLPIFNVSHFRKSNAATAAVAVTIDLTAASKADKPTKILTVESKHELGLMATPEGIRGSWHGQPWGEAVPYGKLATHPASFTRDGSTYISFTSVFSGCSGAGWNGIGGLMCYDVNGSLLISYPLLASAENRDFAAITANLDFVKIISVTPDVSRNTAEVASQAAAQAARAQRKFLKNRGEWLSPTEWVFTGIGILVLLGSISVACIRKGKW